MVGNTGYRLQVTGMQTLARMSRVGKRWGLLHPMAWVIGAGSNKRIDVTIPPGIWLSVALGDPYWLTAAMDGEYEPELGAFFNRMPPEPTLFVDCGANIGWWSLVVERTLGWRAVAIEACASLVRDIERNRSLNECRFDIEHAAIWSSSGETLTLKTGRAAHAGNHLQSVTGYVAKWRQPGRENVASLTVDDIVKRRKRPGERVVVKLDVEGAELAALEGAAETIDAGATVIFEDHGADSQCRVTAGVLDMGLRVHYLAKSGLRPITKVSEARELKKNPRVGYNFVAWKRADPTLLR